MNDIVLKVSCEPAITPTMFCLICLLLSCFYLCAADPIKFKDCGSTGTLDDVDISPCPIQPCSFKHGENATVKIVFKP
ncbi:hypothetical protein CHS0354_001500, partial [Potamilus streckersoni]